MRKYKRTYKESADLQVGVILLSMHLCGSPVSDVYKRKDRGERRMKTVLIGGFEEVCRRERHQSDTRALWQVRSYALLQLIWLCEQITDGIYFAPKVERGDYPRRRNAIAFDWETFQSVGAGKAEPSECHNFLILKRPEEWNASSWQKPSKAVAYRWADDVIDASAGCGAKTLFIIGTGSLFDEALPRADEVVIFTPESLVDEEREVASNILHLKASLETEDLLPLILWLRQDPLREDQTLAYLYWYMR
jgi:dihydrofolate reductase